MISRELPPAARIAIAVLVLAVFVCPVLPMVGDGDPGMRALLCCFVLAVVLGVFLLARRWSGPVFSTLVRPQRPGRLPPPVGRPPDPIALGSLLI